MGDSQRSAIEQAIAKAFDAYAVTIESMKARQVPLALPSQHDPLRSAIDELARALSSPANSGKK